MTQLLIGLTGGAHSGKTTAAKHLAEFFAQVEEALRIVTTRATPRAAA